LRRWTIGRRRDRRTCARRRRWRRTDLIVDGPVWTSAGASAGIDLALSTIEKAPGSEVAQLPVRKLVLYHRRAGGQSQHSGLLEIDAKPDRIPSALIPRAATLHSR
jgi:transcriptional regulator GlxA family with amidase domain